MKKNLIFMIVVFSLIITAGIIKTEASSFSKAEDKSHKEYSLSSYIPHEPITIINDENFTDYGFPGLGTEEDPYIIENYEIMTEEEYGIFINYISKFFIIRNCNISAFFIGICIYNIYYSEGTSMIINNICTNKWGNGRGIYVANSKVAISNNTCTGGRFAGIELFGSPDSIVTDNTCTDNHDAGISISYSDRVNVTNNFCTNNEWSGINFNDGSEGIITENRCTNNGGDGMWVSHTSEVNITNNICTNNSDGLSLYSSSLCLVKYNHFQENSEYGSRLDHLSANNSFHHNSFIDNNLGGTSQAKDDGEYNIWFEEMIQEGNYWSGWNKDKPYLIDGDANSTDPYPLNEKLNRIAYDFTLIIPAIILGISILKINKKKRV